MITQLPPAQPITQLPPAPSFKRHGLQLITVWTYRKMMEDNVHFPPPPPPRLHAPVEYDSSSQGALGALLKGPDVGSSHPGPQGPKFNRFWAPGTLLNRCALKFHANHSYFHDFWWHGMKILIFDVKGKTDFF